MVTLIEHIVNELRLSKATTGKRLDMEPTFGELQPGDTVYWITAATKSIEDATCKVIQAGPEKTEFLVNPEIDAYTDDSPNVKKTIIRDIKLLIKNDKAKSAKDNEVVSVPSQYRGINICSGIHGRFFFICSTSLDFALEQIKLHNLTSKL